ncbi:MAG: alpha/beta hydrolase [Terracidiphilus sp.]
MTAFLDVRTAWGGGAVGDEVLIRTGTSRTNYRELSPGDLESFVHGRDVMIATHGFNTNRAQGIEMLSDWESLLGPAPFPGAFIGFLWPGDSEFWHTLSYPVEPRHATDSGNRLAEFVNRNFQNAVSLSFVSHSLGARVILQTIHRTKRPVRRAIVMAGAVSDHCLTGEFAAVPPKVEVISVLASKKDEVLRWAFPLGDLSAEIIDREHPWWESALGRFGPFSRPEHYQPPCQIPEKWNYGHENYLQVQPPAPEPIPLPTDLPISGPLPLGGAPGWQEAFSASFVSTRFR